MHDRFYRLRTLGDSNNERLVFIDDYVDGLEMEDAKTGFGMPTAATWPKDASITLRKGSGRELGELIGTVTNNLIVSKKLREIIERHAQGVEIEFLPFMLYDHRKRLVTDEYVIVNPIGSFDCLDLEASELLWSTDPPRRVLTVNKPVLSRAKLAKAPPIFRIREKPVDYVIGFDIAKEIADLKLRNVLWAKLDVK